MQLLSHLNRAFKSLDPYFGVNPESEEAGKLRASQMNSISKTTPLMMVAKTLCATFVFVAFYQQSPGWHLGFWLVAMYILAGLGFVHTRKSKIRGEVSSASPRAYSKASKAALVSGFLWALMPIFLYPQIAEADRIIIIAVMSGLMGGGAFSLYAVPRAMFTWIALLTFGCALALLQLQTSASLIVLGLLAVYAASLMRASYTMSKTLASNIISSFELENQSETIGLLLKDFSENASDWLWELNSTGQITRGEEEFLNVLRVGFSSIMPGDYHGNLLSETNQVLNMRSVDTLRKYFKSKESFRDIIISSSGVEGSKWISLSGKPLFNIDNEFTGFRGVASDITEKKHSEERIAYLAHNDALTGLVNRANFSKALDDLLDNPAKDTQWSIFYLDLDGFKLVNDTYGHSMGDKLLGEVAKSLIKTVSEKDVVARLGGDEFAILCHSAGTVQSASTLAEAILKALCKPFVIDNVTLDIGVSIGITLRNRDGSDAHTLMNNADLALYRAKAEGRGTYRLYEHQMDEIVKERRNLEADLKAALKNGELSLAYQPLVAAREAKTVSFEALARWTHPHRGAVSPADFIPIAESMGIIAEIGDWVLQEACFEAATWPDHIAVAVNLSPHQFQSNRIIQTVVDALSKSGLPPHRLELEITEGLFMENTEEVMFSLRELKGMGVSISLDDFGTGYSSLSYLLKFPFDKLKIDRSLIVSLDTDPNAKNVLEAITKLASVMNLTVTAEGIETLDQVKVMLSMHCTHFQGFLFGQPLPKADLPAYFLRETQMDLDSDRASLELKRAG